jgi:conjugal transfer pilus assembly protein TraF
MQPEKPLMNVFSSISKQGSQMNKLIMMIGCCLLSGVVQAGNYYADHEVGWFWYDDPKEVIQDHPKTPTTVSTDPNVIVNTAKQKISTALNQAIVSPTVENISKYIELQEAMGARAETISEVWQQALLKRPDLNYSLKHPTNNVALQVYHEEESRGKEAAIAIFAKKTGLFFFYKSTCPYCKRFAPILKNFATRYGITVIPVTMDGIPLPEFPDSRSDSGQSKKFQVTVTPSLYAVNPYNQKAYPVAYGLTSETELRENIYKIMSREGKS